jgi:hypothetical protein
VPPPVTPPNTTAEIGADTIAATMPVIRPLATAYTAPTSRRRKIAYAMRPTNAAMTTRNRIRDWSNVAGSKNVVLAYVSGSAYARVYV